MPDRKIILNGRFATPADVDAQIARESAALRQRLDPSVLTKFADVVMANAPSSPLIEYHRPARPTLDDQSDESPRAYIRVPVIKVPKKRSRRDSSALLADVRTSRKKSAAAPSHKKVSEGND